MSSLSYTLKKLCNLFSCIQMPHTVQEDYPKLSAAVAGERKFDVYMGIDVFGRNTYGGGQWKVCAHMNLWTYGNFVDPL